MALRPHPGPVLLVLPMAVILDSNLQTDLRLAAVLDRALYELLADSASIRTTGSVGYYGSINGTGGATKRVRLAGLNGTDAMATQAAENTSVANTSLTDASSDIAVSRGSLRYDISDLASMTGFEGSDVDPMRLAASMVVAYERWWNSILCSSITSFTTDAGTSGVDASVDDLFDAIAILELANVQGPYTLLIHARQLADLQSSIRGEAGAFQFMPATADMLAIKGQGYQGSILGVDVFRSSDVTSSGGNRHGAMWGSGALGYADAVPPTPMSANSTTFANTPILVEFSRTSEEATTLVVGHGYAGTGIIQDSAGCGFVTDA